MRRGARMGLAIGLGYVLGRRRKLRKALLLTGAVAVGRLSRDSGQLLRLGSGALQSSPELSRLTRLGAPLVAAGKAAAVAAAGSGVDAIGNRMRGRAEVLRQRTGASAGPDEADERRAAADREVSDEPETDEPETGADEPEADWDEPDDEPVRRRTATAGRRRGR